MYENRTGLHMAIETDHIDIAESLVHNKANLDYQNKDERATPLFLAMWKKN